MNINPDDPKWTAFVLGEMNTTERAQVEKELESSAAAREAVEEIRLATILLKDELATAAPVGLLAEQKRAVLAAVPAARPTSIFSIRRAFAMTAAAVAACLIIATVTIPSLLRSRQAAN